MLGRAGEGKRWRIWEQSREFLLPAPGASVLRSSLGEGNSPSCSCPRTPGAQRGAPHPGGGDGFRLEVVEGQLGLNATRGCGELDESGKSVDQSQGEWARAAGGAEGSAGFPGVSAVPCPVAARGPRAPPSRGAQPLSGRSPPKGAGGSATPSAPSPAARVSFQRPFRAFLPGSSANSSPGGGDRPQLRARGPAAVAAAGRLGAPRGPAAAGRALPPRLPNPGTGKAAEFG